MPSPPFSLSGPAAPASSGERPDAARDRARECVGRGALFAVNHSGGKDSQAMLLRLLELVPAAQIVVVHASLGEVEWPGALEHAQTGAAAAGLPFLVARAGKGFLEMVEHRLATRPEVPSWPSAATRQCTSDLKRGPIEREIRRYARAHGFSVVVNCMGIRAAESPARAKKAAWRRNDRLSIAGREWYDWLPIHDLNTAEVFAAIREADQEPHPAYASGNERLSCVFCILSSANDLRNGAIRNPDLYARYVALEARTGYTAHQSRRPLPAITGLTVEQARAAHALRGILPTGGDRPAPDSTAGPAIAINPGEDRRLPIAAGPPPADPLQPGQGINDPGGSPFLPGSTGRPAQDWSGPAAAGSPALRAYREALRKVEAGEELVCRDLAALGVEGVAWHDPHLQSVSDAPGSRCFCWTDPAESAGLREHGSLYLPAEYEVQPCDDQQTWTTASGVKLRLCCGCRDQYDGWLAIEAAVDAALREEARA